MKKSSLSILASIAFLAVSSGVAAQGPQQLTVGLYPYVPRLAQFKTALRAQWKAVQPGVTLNFLPDSVWDGGYEMNPPANADVYVFDAMFFEYFRSQKLLEPLADTEIQGLNDFVPYTLAGVRHDGKYFAIPQLGCADLLFYHSADSAMAKVTTLTQLKGVLGQCSYTSQIPPDKRGLMVDMSGGTTDAALYLEASHSLTGVYPFPLPMKEADVNPSAIRDLRQMLSTASYINATKSSGGGPYRFGTWFSNGWGRAYVGYSESMSAMTEAARNDAAFKVAPFSDNATAQPTFYADVIGLNPATNQRGSRALSVQLANVMASTANMVQSIGSDSTHPYPQYLMSTRPSVFAKLGAQFPMYNRIYGLISSSNPVLFKANDSVRIWLSAMKGPLMQDILANPRCGCDFPASQTIMSNAGAAAICSPTCSTHGGWNGQWTNEPPAAQQGSVCGCNTCQAQ